MFPMQAEIECSLSFFQRSQRRPLRVPSAQVLNLLHLSEVIKYIKENIGEADMALFGMRLK